MDSDPPEWNGENTGREKNKKLTEWLKENGKLDWKDMLDEQTDAGSVGSVWMILIMVLSVAGAAALSGIVCAVVMRRKDS